MWISLLEEANTQSLQGNGMPCLINFGMWCGTVTKRKCDQKWRNFNFALNYPIQQQRDCYNCNQIVGKLFLSWSLFGVSSYCAYSPWSTASLQWWSASSCASPWPGYISPSLSSSAWHRTTKLPPSFSPGSCSSATVPLSSSSLV